MAGTVANTLRLLARRVQHLERRGVGPDSAAALLIAAGDNPERLGREASFSALCGASPIEASSGKTRRHRLNRGGDRRYIAREIYNFIPPATTPGATTINTLPAAT